MNSALYEGRVRHRRFGEPRREFAYSVGFLYLDLDELAQVFRGRWLWSVEGRTPYSFSRRSHLGDPRRPLADCVRELVLERTGCLARGPIRMLTQARVVGWVFDPVSFYYVFDEPGRRVEHLVAEIRNTPWNEMHCYVLSCAAGERPDARLDASDGRAHFEFRKQFHISPFFGMELDYRWSFSAPAERLWVSMHTLERGQSVFEASLEAQRQELDASNLARFTARHPLMSAKVIAAIYWQALRLKLAGAPFHEHPRVRARAKART